MATNPGEPKPFTLVVARQRKVMGVKYRTESEERRHYATEANLMRGIKRYYSARLWLAGLKGGLIIFSNISAYERFSMFAYEDIPGTWIKRTLDLSHVCEVHKNGKTLGEPVSTKL